MLEKVALPDDAVLTGCCARTMVESISARLRSSLPALAVARYHATMARWGTPFFNPPLPAHVNRVVIAVLAGQVAPWTTRALTVEHGLESHPVADLALKTALDPPWWEGRFDLCPRRVTQVQKPFVVHSPNSTSLERTANIL